MRFFFDSTQRPVRPEFNVRETPSYFEFETRINDSEMPGASYFYVIPMSASAVMVAACWGHEPDAMVTLFGDPKFGKDWFRVFCETYPIQGEPFQNGVDERYSDGALVRFEDPDDGEPKWSVVTIVGNIDLGGEPDDPTIADQYALSGNQRFLAHTRIMAAFELVGMKSFLAAQEYVTNEVSGLAKAKLVAKGGLAGIFGRPEHWCDLDR